MGVLRVFIVISCLESSLASRLHIIFFFFSFSQLDGSPVSQSHCT